MELVSYKMCLNQEVHALKLAIISFKITTSDSLVIIFTLSKWGFYLFHFVFVFFLFFFSGFFFLVSMKSSADL